MLNRIRIIISLISFSCFFCWTTTWGQQTKTVPLLTETRQYQFKVECPIYKSDIIASKIDNNYLIAPKGARFYLIDYVREYAVIRFVLFKSTKLIDEFDLEEDYTKYKYFVITKAQLDFNTRPIYGNDISLSVGSVLIPIKLRTSPFYFSKDFSLGSTIGLRFLIQPRTNIYFNTLLGMGVSSITLDSATTSGRILKTAEVLAFTPSFGGVLEFGNAQVGFFTGLDILPSLNPETEDWIYKNKLWLSFGIGFSLYGADPRRP